MLVDHVPSPSLTYSNVEYCAEESVLEQLRKEAQRLKDVTAQAEKVGFIKSPSILHSH